MMCLDLFLHGFEESFLVLINNLNKFTSLELGTNTGYFVLTVSLQWKTLELTAFQVWYHTELL
jgi:hypothetical protein